MRMTEEWRPLETKAPGRLHRLGNPDSWTDDYCEGSFWRQKLERWLFERSSVEPFVDPQCGAQLPRARAQPPEVIGTAPGGHPIKARGRLQRAVSTPLPTRHTKFRQQWMPRYT